jgi:hypothetical protein
VAAVCDALGVPAVRPGRVIKVLAATMALGEAAGRPADDAYGPILSAMAVLEADYDRISRLVDAHSEQELVEAAELARLHVADMTDLLEDHAETFGRFSVDPRYRGQAQRAAATVARLDLLASDVLAEISGRADDLGRGGLRFDRQDVRDLVARTDLGTLAGLVEASVRPPPAVPPVDSAAVVAVLDAYLERLTSGTPPLPPPTELPVEPVPDSLPDLVRLAADALRWLAERDEGELADWVVGGTWDDATGRMVAAVEAWSRHGPAGDASLPVELDAWPELEAVNRDGVGAVSRTLVRARAPLDVTGLPDLADLSGRQGPSELDGSPGLEGLPGLAEDGGR